MAQNKFAAAERTFFFDIVNMLLFFRFALIGQRLKLLCKLMYLISRIQVYRRMKVRTQFFQHIGLSDNDNLVSIIRNAFQTASFRENDVGDKR